MKRLLSQRQNASAARAKHVTYTFLMILGGACFAGFEAWAGDIVAADPAIGRLNHAGFKTRSHCTGFVITSGTIVTAAHCLPKARTDLVHVLLGYESGKMERSFRTPANSYRSIPTRDIAALCDDVKPQNGLRLTQKVSLNIGSKVAVHGYGTPRVHVLQKTTCSIQANPEDGVLVLDCGLPPGTSGAPVTVADTRNIIGVVSASSPTRTLVSRLTAERLGRLCRSPSQGKAVPSP